MVMVNMVNCNNKLAPDGHLEYKVRMNNNSESFVQLIGYFSHKISNMISTGTGIWKGRCVLYFAFPSLLKAEYVILIVTSDASAGRSMASLKYH